MEELSVGTVVQFKSGGPTMTVTGKGTLPDHVYCEWFTDDGKKTGDQFHPATLDVISRPT